MHVHTLCLPSLIVAGQTVPVGLFNFILFYELCIAQCLMINTTVFQGLAKLCTHIQLFVRYVTTIRAS